MANTIGGSVVWDLDIDDKAFKAGLANAKKAAADTAKEVDNTFKGLSQSISNSFNDARNASFAFAGGLAAVGAAGIAAVGFGVKMAADIETARQGFTTLLGSAKLADEAIAQIKKDAAATPFEFSNLVRANQMLTAVTKNAPQSEKLLLNVGKALAAAGKSSTELDNVIVNLQQIANTAHISELDIRQFGFAGINILELLADHYGTTKEQAADMVKNSKNAFADLEAAFAKAGEGSGKFSRAFIDQAGTFNQLMSNFGDIISQTAGDIVTSSGIFDAVKGAIGGITQALVNFKPQIVQGIKDFISFVVANGPIILGIIVGGLIPAFGGLAISIGLSTIQLLPWIALGVALVTVGNLIINMLGGWAEVQAKVTAALQLAADIFNTYLKPSLDALWQTIQTQLIPELKRLWDIVSPVLGPALVALAKIVLTVLVVALVVIIETLRVVIGWVSTTLNAFNNLIEFFKGIPDAIRSAFAGVYQAITQPFIDAYNKVRQIAQDIKNALDKINPFHRESPSLVDNVIAGVREIKDQYASLSDISVPALAHAMPEVGGGQSSKSGSSGNRTGSGLASQPIQINIDKMNVREQSDITGIARELGFRIQTAPIFIDNG